MAEVQIQKIEELTPWVEKYRPNVLNDIISHEQVISTIQKFVQKGELPHLLLHGPPGTGKTSTILAVCKELYGESRSSFVLELNASDDRGISVVRDQIKTFAESKNHYNTCEKTALKLIILDEADHMTYPAQNAMRRIMENYAKNVRFCLLCNYVNKITPAIQSRCTSFRFSPLKKEYMVNKALDIAKSENVELTKDGLDSLIHVGRGDMRRILNCLQVVSLSHKNMTIDQNVILSTLDIPLPGEVKEILNHFTKSTMKESYEFVTKLQSTKGYSIKDIMVNLYESILTYDFPDSAMCLLLKNFGEIEERCSSGANEQITLSALISAFIEFRTELFKMKYDMNNI
ncbi:replication factor C3, putative [Plasmodium knowlesi strain H]|uniref:Replication factor C3, putative n=3 Tax=Plasmodium knowlesi TaxID=5850 RepID=A0A5K1VDT1_PLAKH|nr:replication factor C subunit 3, putative [Plasmodium knowlesi strain H]OTN65671.1 putative Replication factor C3 [Plasmodium knowlesi]CAA9989509.1 replication factor C subunit 3, putative [Plasmodium knowlesi strain H]SBO25194.1 replication factor C3, putative [Plasmodium knowlesi strain H]SBO27763.1 replication factor C3, putative [Plasmodium knowlesi strain H]VVS78983.1 replication factor C subunit 3, putative [Plasmodium knowlesi strain H]|eukprot:XP_002260234.1 replication factor C3, putative [Plasmodium knowlesi strain H]